MEHKRLVWLSVLMGTGFLYWSCSVILRNPSQTPLVITFENMSHIIHANRSEDTCTFPLIRSHVFQHTSFKESGRVVGFEKENSSSSSSERVFYDPGMCHLTPNLGDYTWLSSCLMKTNTTKIFFVGDSNIRRPTERFLEILEENDMLECNSVRNKVPRNENGTLAIPKIKPKNDCQWIFTNIFVCKRATGRNLTIYYTMMNEMKSSVNLLNSKNSIICPKVIKRNARTLQQYIFEDYAEQIKPDIIIIGSTAHTRYLPLSQWRTQQMWLMRLVIDVVSPSIPIMWLSQMSWCEQNLPPNNPHHVNKVHDNGTVYTINQQVHRQNLEFHKLFKQILLTDRNNIFPFFDIYNLSSLVRPEWYIDWVHCRPDYYELLMRTFWGVFCNSFTH